MRNKYLDTLDDPDFEVTPHDIARERAEWYEKVVACYEYNRQWLSYLDAVNAMYRSWSMGKMKQFKQATMARFDIAKETLRRK